MQQMNWSVNKIPSQKGRIALITGANSGLGLETARVLVEKGATVILGCRSFEKAHSTIKKFIDSKSDGSTEFIKIDLSDLRQVKMAAEQLRMRHRRLDLLINNAGIMAPPRTLSKQGWELQFAVNHLAHMALTLELIPLLNQYSGSRVVTVSSGAQFLGKINWDDLQGEHLYNRWAAYSQSKLANVMFAMELHHRLRKSNSKTSSLMAHPGLARTNLQSTSLAANGSWQESVAYKLMTPIFQSALMGALPQLLAATSSTAKSGEQYGPKYNFKGPPRLCRVAPLALDKSQREKLWEKSKCLIDSLEVNSN